MVALTLDQLDIGASARVLEVGTGTGYSAALLAALTGSSGLVVTIEIDETLAARAEEALRQWASTPVRVIFGDGRLGHPEYAPYDRIVVTAGVPAIAPAWSDQLTDGGCLVVPVVDHRGAGSLLTLRKIGGDLVQRAARPCRFVRLRSAAERPAT
jgi:protein-L-isoaspartate(D-aspartate) O-methyltransferase